MPNTDRDAVERLARRIETKEPYKSAMQIACDEGLPHQLCKTVGEILLCLGQGDYPTIRDVADRATSDANAAAATLRALLAAKEAAEAERDEWKNAAMNGESYDLWATHPISQSLVAQMEAAEAEASALREKLEVAVEGLTDIASKVSWEINPSNYDHIEVRDMNSDWCEIGNIADATLTTLNQPKEGEDNDG